MLSQRTLRQLIARKYRSVMYNIGQKMGEVVDIVDLGPSDSRWQEIVTKTSEALLKEKVVSVPTDTIYGVAALAQSKTGIQSIYDIKQRENGKPIAICVGDVEDVYKWGNVTISSQLLQELLPGPVTLIFERTLELNPLLNPTTSLVGIRIPDHDFIRQLARKCQQPLALTSANISHTASTVNIEEFKELWNKLEVIVNGGTLGYNAEARLGSTVVNLSKPGQFSVVRRGSAYVQTVNLLKKYSLKENEES